MKREIRRNVFETNSSSTHSLSICTEQEFEDWKAGKLLFDRWGERFILPYQLSEEEKSKAAKEYTANKREYYKDWDELNDVQKEKWYSSYMKEHNLGDDDGVSYDDYFSNGYLETYTRHYVTPSGDKIICFGEYGYDG